jgi:hypothetical protein
MAKPTDYEAETHALNLESLIDGDPHDGLGSILQPVVDFLRKLQSSKVLKTARELLAEAQVEMTDRDQLVRKTFHGCVGVSCEECDG